MGVEKDTLGLIIWSLSGGGYALGKLFSGRRGGEREVLIIYIEIMYVGFKSGGALIRFLWVSGRSRGRESRGIGRVFRNVMSFFGKTELGFWTIRMEMRGGDFDSPKHKVDSINLRRSTRKRKAVNLEDYIDSSGYEDEDIMVLPWMKDSGVQPSYGMNCDISSYVLKI